MSRDARRKITAWLPKSKQRRQQHKWLLWIAGQRKETFNMIAAGERNSMSAITLFDMTHHIQYLTHVTICGAALPGRQIGGLSEGVGRGMMGLNCWNVYVGVRCRGKGREGGETRVCVCGGGVTSSLNFVIIPEQIDLNPADDHLCARTRIHRDKNEMPV